MSVMVYKSYLRRFLLSLIALFVGASALAQPLSSSPEDPSLKFGTYQESFKDLEVKVRGGVIGTSRVWRGDTGEWTFNPQREDLVLSPETQGEAFGEALAKRISRGPRMLEQSGQVGFYQRISETASGGVSAAPPTNNTTQFLAQNPGIQRCSSEGPTQSEVIVVNASGYKWVERVTRQWAQYDFAGKLKEWGEGNFRIGQVLRDGSGRVRGYADTSDREVITFTWNAQGLIERISDYQGREFEYDYTAAGLLERVTDPDGVRTEYVYSGEQMTGMRVGSLTGVPSGMAASHQALTVMGYGGGKSLTLKQDQDGKEVLYTYEYDKPRGLYIKTETASGNRVTRWTWDIENNLISVQKNGEYELRMDKVCEDSVIIDRSNRLTYVDRDAIGFIKDIYHPNGTRTRYQNSQQNWPELNQVWSASNSAAPWGVTKVTLPSGATIDYVRNSIGKPVSELHTENGESKRWTYTYDSYGNVTERRLLEGTSPNNAVDMLDIWHYNADGNPDYYEDAVQRRWLYEYNSRGDRTKVTDPSGKVWRYFYNGKGQLLRVLDPIGYERLYEYSNRGLLLFIRDRFDVGQEAVTGYKYNYRGLITEITDPLGHVWRFEYNDSGEVAIATDPEQKTTSYTYDFRGRVKSVKDGNNVEIFYDYFDSAGSGLPPQTSMPFQAFERVTYPTMVEEVYHDLLGRTVRTVRRPNQGAEQSIIFEWNPDSRLTAIHRPDGQVVTFTADILGRPLTHTEPGIGTYTWEYPDGVRTSRYIDPTGGVVEKRFNPAGDLVSEIRANHSQVSYNYDSNGRLYEFVNTSGNRQRYTYSDAGDLVSERIYAPGALTAPVKTVQYYRNLRGDYLGYNDGTTSQTRTVDKLGRVLTSARNFGPFTKSRAYTYTPNGNVATHITASGVQLSYLWDAADNFQGVVIPGEGSISLGYNQQNWVDPISITFPGGASQSIQYDDLRRVRRLTSRDQAQSVIMDSIYSYRTGPLSDGLVESITTEDGAYSYGYDNGFRLLSVTGPAGSESYTYDGLGRRQPGTGAPWTYNANGAPLITGSATYTYDVDGNRVTKSDSVITTYSYDESNRLIRVERPAGNVVERYGYDPMGERLWKENGAGARTYFEYNEDGIEAELDSSGNVIKSYIFAPGSVWGTNPLAMKQGNSYSYYHNDHQGRPVKLTNNVGAVTWSGRYSAYGIGAITSQGATNPIRAPGQYSDPETGLYNNFQRNYDPEVGAYLEEDPFGTFGGPNRYNYGDNSPLRLYDHTGQWTTDDVERALAYTALIMGGAALGTAVTIGSSPILVPLIVAGTIADLGIGGINGYQCYNHFRDPCNANYSNYDCLDALLGTAGAAGGATALRGLTKVSGKVVPAGGQVSEVLPNLWPDKFRRVPRTLAEQLALEEAKAGAGKIVKRGLRDIRFKGMDKYAHHHRTPDGRGIEIHYVVDPTSGNVMDFKFID